jgi:hypothetical protein
MISKVTFLGILPSVVLSNFISNDPTGTLGTSCSS